MALDDTHPARDSDVLQDDSLVAVDFDGETGSWAMLPSEGNKVWRCPVCSFDNPGKLASCGICRSFRNPSLYQGFAQKKIGASVKPSALATALFSPLPPIKLKKHSVIHEVMNKIVESNPLKVSRSSVTCNAEMHIEPFKFEEPSPDDLVLRGTLKSSTAGVSSKKGIQEKEAKAKVPLELVKEDKEDVVSQTAEKQTPTDVHAEKTHKKTIMRMKAPLESYKPESWILEASKQGIKQILHLAIAGHADTGKSTMMGRILHFLGAVSQNEIHKYEKEAKQIGKGSFSYAWVLDESSEERSRGTTMAVAVAHFETPKFRVVVLDLPGHRDFVPSMISGASQADAAILVVDASMGAFEAGMECEGGQTREHTLLLRSLGIEQVIVAVNKMDSVDYLRGRFDAIKAALRTFLRQCGFKDLGIKWIPVSAMENQNLVTPPTQEKLKTWFSGPTLIEAVESFEAPIRSIEKPLRMLIAETFKSRMLGQAVASGKVEAGAVRIGSKVLVMPASLPATVKAMEQNGVRQTCAKAGDSIDIGLQGIDPECLIQGGVLCHPDFIVPSVSRLELKIILLETSSPLLRGSQVVLHSHHAKEPATVTQLVCLLDQKGQAIPGKKPRCLLGSQRAIVEVVLERPMCIEEYSQCKALGRIVLRDRGMTLAAGIVIGVIECE